MNMYASSQRATEAWIQQRGLTRASAAARLMSEAMVAHNRNRSISKIQQSHRDSLRHRWVERVLMLFCSADYLIKDQMVNERPVEVFSAVCPRRGTRQRRPYAWRCALHIGAGIPAAAPSCYLVACTAIWCCGRSVTGPLRCRALHVPDLMIR
jgi:hypothetical protein